MTRSLHHVVILMTMSVALLSRHWHLREGSLRAEGSGIPKVADARTTDGSDIGITIMGTIVQKKDENNVALIKEQKSGKVVAVKPGYKVLEKYTVVVISGKYMIIRGENGRVLVYQDKFAGEFLKSASDPSLSAAATAYSGDAPEYFKEEGFERQANSVAMTSAYRDKIVNQDMANILMQATAEPHLENGQVAGFKLSQIDAGSVYWKGGLKDDDIITEINGQKMDSVARAIGILKSLKQESAIEVHVIRKGAPVRFNLKIN